VPNISNAARDIPQLFKADLQKDEKIIWSGRPEPQWFTTEDFLLVPFSLVWGGFAYLWEASVLQIYFKHPNGGALFMVFWGIPFVLIGSNFIFGRFFYRRWLQNNIFYAVTNQRVLILSTTRNRSLQTLFVDRLPELNKTANKKGVGTIAFGGNPLLARYAGLGTGLSTSLGGGTALNRRSRVPPPAAFTNIKDVDRVYELIGKQSSKT
jgi:hypothetical protein